jgi:hypothetical protein
MLSVAGAASNLAATVNSNLQGSADSMPNAIMIVFDVTFVGGTAPTLQLIFEAYDPVSNKFIAWGTAGFTALSATGTAVYIIALSSGMTVAGGITTAINLPVPPIWRVRTVAGGTIGTVSFTAAAFIIPTLN